MSNIPDGVFTLPEIKRQCRACVAAFDEWPFRSASVEGGVCGLKEFAACVVVNDDGDAIPVFYDHPDIVEALLFGVRESEFLAAKEIVKKERLSVLNPSDNSI